MTSQKTNTMPVVDLSVSRARIDEIDAQIIELFERRMHIAADVAAYKRATGKPVVVRCAFKPTPSISRAQHSIDMQAGANEDLSVHGRHDPCVVVRAVPVVEAAVALALYDLLLESRMD